MMRAGPKIVACYSLAIIAVIVLQIIPIPGIFLMMLGALTWAAVLLNLMLLHLAGAALLGSIERQWLIIPIVAYACWGAYAGFDFLQALALKNSIMESNERVAKLSADENDFVIVTGSKDYVDRIALDFVTIFETAQIYEDNRQYFRVRDDRCKARNDPNAIRIHGASPTLSRAKRPAGYGGELSPGRYEGWRIISVPASTPPAAIRISVRRDQREAGARIHFGKTITVERMTPDGRQQALGEIRDGAIHYVAPFPFFIAGCGLNSGAAKWECGFQVRRWKMWVGEAGELNWMNRSLDQATYVARLLGVPHR